MTTNTTRRPSRRAALTAVIGVAGAAFLGGGTASADTILTYTGQGIDADGDFESEVCGTENGAEADGEYILFILTGNGITSATLQTPEGSGSMTQSGNGAWKYVYTGGADPADLVDVAFADYDGTPRGNPQLVISHGCPGDDHPPS